MGVLPVVLLQLLRAYYVLSDSVGPCQQLMTIHSITRRSASLKDRNSCCAVSGLANCSVSSWLRSVTLRHLYSETEKDRFGEFGVWSEVPMKSRNEDPLGGLGCPQQMPFSARWGS